MGEAEEAGREDGHIFKWEDIGDDPAAWMSLKNFNLNL